MLSRAAGGIGVIIERAKRSPASGAYVMVGRSVYCPWAPSVTLLFGTPGTTPLVLKTLPPAENVLCTV